MSKSYCLLLLLAFSTITLQAQSNEWRQLFNGKDLTGWKHVGPGGDTVEDGLIKTHGGMGLLLDWMYAAKLRDPGGVQDARQQ